MTSEIDTETKGAGEGKEKKPGQGRPREREGRERSGRRGSRHCFPFPSLPFSLFLLPFSPGAPSLCDFFERASQSSSRSTQKVLNEIRRNAERYLFGYGLSKEKQEKGRGGVDGEPCSMMKKTINLRGSHERAAALEAEAAGSTSGQEGGRVVDSDDEDEGLEELGAAAAAAEEEAPAADALLAAPPAVGGIPTLTLPFPARL